ncbi:hypothetical protein [Hufsiella ginkgonis]|uniref:Uncharacterized protein n=1 Tax=Hufsiella ginkgonis TaxID=2695274 RepID=A0A7K1XYK9_9SPHI|nr:hypothetical protein [Hufsiella ginkgonis]MXV16060.1 hypothetical protein [Hufsiella ginkgonis]
MRKENNPVGSEQLVARLTVLIAGLYLFRIAVMPEIIQALFSNFLRSWQDCLYYLFNQVLVVPGLVAFYRRKWLGWALMIVYTGYQAVHNIVLLSSGSLQVMGYLTLGVLLVAYGYAFIALCLPVLKKRSNA